ncbi:hypothetical protein HD554DRAFT_1832667 [Boletus coccyginus]|nr:hypothetical protein HD554DRAFT_1832667 [Boletus coccyginus]
MIMYFLLSATFVSGAGQGLRCYLVPREEKVPVLLFAHCLGSPPTLFRRRRLLIKSTHVTNEPCRLFCSHRSTCLYLSFPETLSIPNFFFLPTLSFTF